MKQELVIAKSEVLSVESKAVTVPDFNNINLGEEPRRLKVKVRKAKTKQNGKDKIFNSISAYVKLPVYEGVGDDAEYVGVKVKLLSVHFRKDAFKGCSNLSSPEDENFKSGYLYVKAKGLRIPNAYRVVEEKDENGEVIYNEDGTAKLKYPEIWIEQGILGLQAFVTSQSALDVDDDKEVVEAETVENEETGEMEAVSDLENEELDEEETVL